MNRRDFLKGILATATAPAIVKADSLMKIYVPPEKNILLPPIFYLDYTAPDGIIVATPTAINNVYVNPLAPPGGDGTIGRPYSSFLEWSTKTYPFADGLVLA